MAKHKTDIDMQSQSTNLPSGDKYKLTYDRRLKIQIVDSYGIPQVDCGYILTVGSEEHDGRTDEEGWLKVDGLPPGEISIRLEDGKLINILDDEEREIFEKELKDKTIDEEENIDNEDFFAYEEEVEFEEEDDLTEFEDYNVDDIEYFKNDSDNNIEEYEESFNLDSDYEDSDENSEDEEEESNEEYEESENEEESNNDYMETEDEDKI
jgi:hypothetical protein